MKNNMINVPVEFVIDALQARYDEVEHEWACDASASLWDQALDIVAECGLGEHVTSPSIFVDNYLINGEFVSKEKDFDQWSKDYEDRYDFSDSLEVIEAWQDYCENNAILFNDQYACLRF